MYTLLFLLLLSCAYANDNQIDGNFATLNEEISNSDSYFNLTKNYTQSVTEDTVDIYESIEINGNGHSISSDYHESLLKIKNNANLTLNNITFNYKISTILDSEDWIDNTTITFVDCVFIQNSDEIYASDPALKDTYSCKITQEIKDLAYSIIGKSTGMDAAKKLAKWVHDNMGSEKKAGFYQSPTDTLNRKKGNCCCRLELFLQMCDAIGFTKEHEIYIVHVGNITFGERHFFTIIDNICVDVTLSKYWGKGGFSDRSVFSITKYPVLPIPRAY